MNLTDDQYTYSVTEITREVKFLLESSLATVLVQGEISNFTLHSSGHMYFSLKDENAQLSCVMWKNRSTSLGFIPEDGMMVIVRGKITVYEKRGNYQLDVHFLQPIGLGALQIAFEKLKNRLMEEGLFNNQFKKPLPQYPERIGIVTSATGAAIRDLVSVLRRRFPAVEIILRPTLVQGEGAAQDIANAIAEFNEYGNIDVLIIGRGGGSIEDLWAFNEEIVARAIFNSKIPTVSAVGHEIDFCISDFVADLRAPTPSAAAEIVVRDKREIQSDLSEMLRKSYTAILDLVHYFKETLKHIQSSYGFHRPQDLLYQYRQRLDELKKLHEISIRNKINFLKEQYKQLFYRLKVLGPNAILERGYSICWSPDKGKIITDAHTVTSGEALAVHFYRGGIRSRIEQIIPDEQIKDIMRTDSK